MISSHFCDFHHENIYSALSLKLFLLVAKTRYVLVWVVLDKTYDIDDYFINC